MVKIGDKVKIKGNKSPKKGKIGIVVGIDGISNYVLVRFSDGIEIWYGFSNVEVIKEFSVLESKVGDE
ncbi:MAG TPA: hypothetical protein ENG16_00580 [Archaeoglobus sp.]|nr:hypothetical protein [Archaeoglobus sp.]